MPITDAELANRFSYHPATADTAATYAQVRAKFLDLAVWINATAPESRDKSLALTELQSAMHWTNSAIAMTTPIADDPERART